MIFRINLIKTLFSPLRTAHRAIHQTHTIFQSTDDKYKDLWNSDEEGFTFKMPKSKEIISSDSSSEEEKPQKVKKSKQPAKSKRARSPAPDDDEPRKKPSSSEPKQEESEPCWELGNNRQIKVREFKGKLLVDIREFYQDSNSGELKPGKKGISLSAAQYLKLAEYMEEITDAVKAKLP